VSHKASQDHKHPDRIFYRFAIVCASLWLVILCFLAAGKKAVHDFATVDGFGELLGLA